MDKAPRPEQPQSFLPKVSEATFAAFLRDVQEKSPREMIPYFQTIQQENPEIDQVLKTLVFDEDNEMRPGSEDVMTAAAIVYTTLRKQAEAKRMEKELQGRATNESHLLPTATKETVDVIEKEFIDWAVRENKDPASYCLKHVELIKQENPEIGRFLEQRSLDENGSVRPERVLSFFIGVTFYRSLRQQAEADKMKKDFPG
jgi:hypothetical protein